MCLGAVGAVRFDAGAQERPALRPDHRQNRGRRVSARYKSYTLREVQRGLKTSGRGVQVIAPQRQQVIDLEIFKLLNFADKLGRFPNLKRVLV